MHRYQWIIAYSEKFSVQVFQEEVALCREMVTRSARLPFPSLPFPSLPFPFLPFLRSLPSLIQTQAGVADSRANRCLVIARGCARCIVWVMPESQREAIGWRNKCDRQPRVARDSAFRARCLARANAQRAVDGWRKRRVLRRRSRLRRTAEEWRV